MNPITFFKQQTRLIIIIEHLKQWAWRMTSVLKIAQGCQGGTHHILKLDTLTYHFLQ